MSGARLAVASLAVIVAREGELPAGAEEAAAEAGGAALVVGEGAEPAATALRAARRRWWADTGPPSQLAALAGALAPALVDVPLIVLPAGADGRDLAPRLAAALDRPLLTRAVRVGPAGSGVRAEVARLDDRLLVTLDCDGPAVATLIPGVRVADPVPEADPPARLPLPVPPPTADPEVVARLAPEPATMDLGEAPRVLAGGAGLVPPGAGVEGGRAMFELLARVGAALRAAAGATRVATDAGWAGHDRQIGTTGVAVSPELYVAFGISGASQHVGGLGDPRHVVSVNLDPSCPMTALADLGLVADAPAVLVELARRLGVEAPDGLPVELPAGRRQDAPEEVEHA